MTIRISEIQSLVMACYGMTPVEMFGVSHQRRLARPRQIAMYLCRMLTKRSLPDIGRRFGGRDHTTVLHSMRRVRERMETSAALRNEVTGLQAELICAESWRAFGYIEPGCWHWEDLHFVRTT